MNRGHQLGESADQHRKFLKSLLEKIIPRLPVDMVKFSVINKIFLLPLYWIRCYCLPERRTEKAVKKLKMLMLYLD